MIYILSASACCKDQVVASWIITTCYMWFQEGFCGEKSTPGGCIVAGIWGLRPLAFPRSLSRAVLCGLQQASFFFTSQPQLETDLRDLSATCHLFPWFHPGSLLGLLMMGTPLESSPRFVFLHQVHEMQ